MPPHSNAEWDYFYAQIRAGVSVRQACRDVEARFKTVMHFNTGYAKVKTLRAQGVDLAAERKVRPFPANWRTMSSEAKAAFDDPAYFRLRYFGHPSEPFAVQTMIRVVEALESDQREFMIENMPPGVGKTTMAHDLSAWVTVRNRAIRGVFASKNATNARRMMRRLRRSFERNRPAKAKPDELKHGMAFDAVATLAGDYGLFKPSSQTDVWNNEEFVVVQADDTPIEEKEPTWTAFGFGSDVLSMRYDLMLCDDMDDKETVRSIEVAEGWRTKWDDEIETRLEPRGVLINIQQRVSPLDLSRYNADKRVPLEPQELAGLTDEEVAAKNDGAPPMYYHIVYKAHDETKCDPAVTHQFDAKPWPEGCLLSPKRLPWADCARIRASKPRMWALGYQQEDVNPETTLVKPVWLEGGTDVDEETHLSFDAPGCYDHTRGLWEFPDKPLSMVASIDPSRANWWAVQLWGVTREENPTVYLFDTIKRRMNADDLLQWTDRDGWTGILPDWQDKSERLGRKITRWIWENNSQNDYLFNRNPFRAWFASRNTLSLPHHTGRNKNTGDLSVYMMREWFKFGRVRLPWAPFARTTTRHLTEELTRYPNPGPYDQVMAAWFVFANMTALAEPPAPPVRQSRPDWAASLDGRPLLRSVS